MKKLFMIGIGGLTSSTNVEVNDVQFIVATSIEETYELLKKDWVGNTLHIDEYKIITFVGDYKLEISDTPWTGDKKLFFVDLGGAIQNQFGEEHEYGMFVTSTLEEAQEKGKAELLTQGYDRHIDCSYALQERLKTTDGKKAYIHLVEVGNDAGSNEYCNTFIVLK